MDNKSLNGIELLELELPEQEFISTNTCVDQISPFSKGGVHIVCASPKSGKSLTLLHLAVNLCKNYKICYLSLENKINIDQKRLMNIVVEENLYNINIEDLNNISFCFLRGTPIDERKKKLEDVLTLPFDIYIIDGTEFLLEGKTGAEMFESGKKLGEMLIKSLEESPSNPTLIMSWQTRREGVSKDIDDIDFSDMSGSIALARQADSVWLLKKWHEKTKKDKKDFKQIYWRLKLIDGRDMYNENDTINVVYAGKFNLNAENYYGQNKNNDL